MDKVTFNSNLRKLLDPVVGLLAALAVPPLLISLFGLAFSLYGAVIVAEGRLFLGGIFLILSGLCDVLDGDVARRRNLVSRFGAFMDSSLDRITEFAYFGGILYYIVNRPDAPHDFLFCAVLVALTGSVMTSYARARAEGLGFECKVGLLERPERIAVVTFGLLLGYRVLGIVLTLLAVASMYTFIQRVLHVHRVSRVVAQAPRDVPSSQPETGPDFSGGPTDEQPRT